MSYQQQESHFEKEPSEQVRPFTFTTNYNPPTFRQHDKIYPEKKVRLHYFLGSILTLLSLLLIIIAISALTIRPDNVWYILGISSTFIVNILFYLISAKIRQKAIAWQARLFITILFVFSFILMLFTATGRPGVLPAFLISWLLAITSITFILIYLRKSTYVPSKP